MGYVVGYGVGFSNGIFFLAFRSALVIILDGFYGSCLRPVFLFPFYFKFGVIADTYLPIYLMGCI